MKPAQASYAPHVVRVAQMLGLRKILPRNLDSPVAVHETIQAGLPRRALFRAMESGGVPRQQMLPVFGISTRTYMRLKREPDKMLDAEQSGRVWQFAELLAKAEDVLGSRELATEWMLKPAMALENRRPIELLTTPVGVHLVDDVIERMRYGVYQ